MIQEWMKIANVFQPDYQLDWMNSHASVPCIDRVKDDIFRVYFGTRDNDNCTSIGYFEFDIRRPTEILNVSEKPVLSKGELGTFDDSGTMPSFLVVHRGTKYLYYIGWNLGVTVPFRNFTGLAISEDNGVSFKRVSKAPVLDRDDIDPFFCTGPGVFIDQNIWRMWYVSCTKWEITAGKPKHFYHLKYAESVDGIRWKKTGQVAVDYEYKNEYAISSPRVIKEDGIYKMWYSYRAGPRGDTYRIGYAESKNAVTWERMDSDVGLDVSKEGWDSEMVCYPCLFDHKGRRYMLYNGNDYGKTGIGLAVLNRSK